MFRNDGVQALKIDEHMTDPKERELFVELMYTYMSLAIAYVAAYMKQTTRKYSVR